MKRLKYFTLILSGLCLFNACKQDDFLERIPLDAITEPVFFKTANDLKLYVNQYYERGNFPVRDGSNGDMGTDNYLTMSGLDLRLQGTRTITNAPALNYTKIRSINYFFENYRKVGGDFETYKQYVGEAHFFKAFFYYDLLRTFGDVQWLDKVLNANSPELYEDRTPRNIVADKILAHLDTAVTHLSAAKIDNGTRINKWVALLFQTRVAMYEGSWEKYHSGTDFGVENPNPDKYFQKAVEAAEQIMSSGEYALYSTGNTNKDYFELFGLRDYSANSEVMFWTKMNLALGIHSHGKLYRLESPAGLGITKSYVDAFLCADGQPIALSPLFKGYNTLSLEMENRDPRLQQTVFNTSHEWLIDASGNIKYWQEVFEDLYTNSTFATPTGYVRRKDYNPILSYHHLNFEETPTAQYRYAEVLLNYIEAKAELGQATQADVDKTIKKLRDRVGMPNLIIQNIAVDPNWSFPTLSPLINEIRRERNVELGLENLRWDDIARWAAADELLLGQRPKGAYAAQYPIKPTFPVDANGFIDPFQVALPTGYGFKINRDYLSPIPMKELTLNKNISQNPGW